MKILTAFFLVFASSAYGQAIVGKWKTIDDNTGEAKSIVEIYERDGKFYGKVIKLFLDPNEDPDPVCDECDKDDSRYKKKIIGMEIIRGLKEDNNEFSGGDILDPENGKVYRCRLWIEDGDLMVRGYWGPFFRTQTWKRA
jgi:uncharacterized protein (DUF2147 family)